MAIISNSYYKNQGYYLWNEDKTYQLECKVIYIYTMDSGRVNVEEDFIHKHSDVYGFDVYITNSISLLESEVIKAKIFVGEGDSAEDYKAFDRKIIIHISTIKSHKHSINDFYYKDEWGVRFISADLKPFKNKLLQQYRHNLQKTILSIKLNYFEKSKSILVLEDYMTTLWVKDNNDNRCLPVAFEFQGQIDHYTRITISDISGIFDSKLPDFSKEDYLRSFFSADHHSDHFKRFMTIFSSLEKIVELEFIRVKNMLASRPLDGFTDWAYFAILHMQNSLEAKIFICMRFAWNMWTPDNYKLISKIISQRNKLAHDGAVTEDSFINVYEIENLYLQILLSSSKFRENL